MPREDEENGSIANDVIKTGFNVMLCTLSAALASLCCHSCALYTFLRTHLLTHEIPVTDTAKPTVALIIDYTETGMQTEMNFNMSLYAENNITTGLWKSVLKARSTKIMLTLCYIK